MLQTELKDQTILSLSKETKAQKSKLEQSKILNETFMITVFDISRRLSTFQREFELKYYELEKRFGYAYDRFKVLNFLLDQQILFNNCKLSEFKVLEKELASLQNDRELLINHIQLISIAKNSVISPSSINPINSTHTVYNSDRFNSSSGQDGANNFYIPNQPRNSIYITKNTDSTKASAYLSKEESFDPIKDDIKSHERFIELNSSDSFSFSSKTETSKKVYTIN